IVSLERVHNAIFRHGSIVGICGEVAAGHKYLPHAVWRDVDPSTRCASHSSYSD
ncbi:unnamed protein product, partial [Linum tenue]